MANGIKPFNISSEHKFPELLQDISRHQTKYLKSTLKNTSFSSVSNDQRSISPTPIHCSSSRTQFLSRIARAYAQVNTFNDEKVALAHNLIALLSRTKARLDADVQKVRNLQGDFIDDIWTSSVLPSNQSLLSSFPASSKGGTAVPGMSTVAEINQSLHGAGATTHAEAAPLYNKSK